VLDDMARRARTKQRPRPQHKRVWAEMTRILEGEPVSGRECYAAQLLDPGACSAKPVHYLEEK